MRVNRIIDKLMLVLGLIAFASCEKVIEVNLKNASPVIVIEGNINNRTDAQYIYIHRSVTFGESNNFPAVSGAVVTVTDNRGRQVTFIEDNPGIYVGYNFIGRPGFTYNLKIQADGKEYKATSVMPLPVVIDSVGVNVGSFFGKEQKTVQLLYSDPPSTPNYYRFLLTINGVKSKNIFAFEDDFTDGRKVVRELLDFDLETNSGYRADIEIQCIDQPMFRYWQGLDQNQNRGGASTTPANPVSNISNGALGYFSAHTTQYTGITLP